jgi:hypothetical protein
MPDIKTDNIELLHNAVQNQSEWDMILMLHKYFLSEGFNFKINPRGKIAFAYKGKKEFLNWQHFPYKSKEGSLYWKDSNIKARLLNIGKYQDKIDLCTENVKNGILGGFDCHDCENRCETQIYFEYKKIKYKKCHPKQWWLNFEFTNPTKNDVESLLELIKFELPYYKSKT